MSAHMAAMTILDGMFMPIRPQQNRVSILETDDDLQWFQIETGIAPDKDGRVTIRENGRETTIPLRGLYRVQEVSGGRLVAGVGLLLTAEQFQARFMDWEEPFFEYGLWAKPRRGDVVVHGTLDAARDALAGLPVLAASGGYVIVRRLVTEPGEWVEVGLQDRRSRAA